MTYPQGLPTSQQPSDIHDATWGVLSAVYGGAVHPSAEGHAAMAELDPAIVAKYLPAQATAVKPAPMKPAPAAPKKNIAPAAGAPAR